MYIATFYAMYRYIDTFFHRVSVHAHCHFLRHRSVHVLCNFFPHVWVHVSVMYIATFYAMYGYTASIYNMPGYIAIFSAIFFKGRRYL